MTTILFPDTSKLVLTAGAALYGDADDWMSQLASEIGVQPYTVSDWANARRTPTLQNVEQLLALLTARAERASRTAATLTSALPRMSCPVHACGEPLRVLHGGERVITCANGHNFLPKSGPPFGPFVEKEFVQVDQSERDKVTASLWLADISEHDFGEFERRVRGLFGPHAGYQEHLRRRHDDWLKKTGQRPVLVPVTVDDLDRYCGRAGSCTARELTALAKAKSEGQL